MPSAERGDEHDAPAGPAGGDRREQDQQRAGRRDEAAGEAEHEQAAPADRSSRRAARGGGGRRRGECSRPSAATGASWTWPEAWSWAGCASWPCSWPVVVRAWSSARARGRGRAWSRASCACSAVRARRHAAPDLGEQHPAADQRRSTPRRPAAPRGPRGPAAASTPPRARRAASARIPSVCDTLTARPEAHGVARRPARADEVRGHQRLAVARRQRRGPRRGRPR